MIIGLHDAMEAVMMGKRVMAEPVFSTVRIDDHLPANHLLRAVDALLDTAFVRRIMAPHYSLIGRPSIDPELMIRMLLVGYLGGIRSAFGVSGVTTARTAWVAIAARRLKRPVKLEATRKQGFTIATYRAETRHRVRLAATREGRLQALLHDGWEATSRPLHLHRFRDRHGGAALCQPERLGQGQRRAA